MRFTDKPKPKQKDCHFFSPATFAICQVCTQTHVDLFLSFIFDFKMQRYLQTAISLLGLFFSAEKFSCRLFSFSFFHLMFLTYIIGASRSSTTKHFIHQTRTSTMLIVSQSCMHNRSSSVCVLNCVVRWLNVCAFPCVVLDHCKSHWVKLKRMKEIVCLDV